MDLRVPGGHHVVDHHDPEIALIGIEGRRLNAMVRVDPVRTTVSMSRLLSNSSSGVPRKLLNRTLTTSSSGSGRRSTVSAPQDPGRSPSFLRKGRLSR